MFPNLFPNCFCTTLLSGSPITFGMDCCQEFLDSLPSCALPGYHGNLSKMQDLAVCIQNLHYSQREARPFGIICEAPVLPSPCHLSHSDVYIHEHTGPSSQITLLIKIVAVLPILALSELHFCLLSWIFLSN